MLYLHSFAFNPFSENTYVVYNDQKKAFLIDPGNFTPEETDQLTQFILEKDLEVVHILLTHAHIDHVLGLQAAFDQYQVPVLMHPLEQEILDRNPMDANRFGFFFQPFKGTVSYITEHDRLNLDEEEFQILHLPGHSPGSIGFYHAAQQLMVSGDVLFEGSMGRTDLYKGNQSDLLTSIRTKLFVLPEETKIYNGHGNPTNIGFEKQYNPYLK